MSCRLTIYHPFHDWYFMKIVQSHGICQPWKINHHIYLAFNAIVKNFSHVQLKPFAILFFKLLARLAKTNDFFDCISSVFTLINSFNSFCTHFRFQEKIRLLTFPILKVYWIWLRQMIFLKIKANIWCTHEILLTINFPRKLHSTIFYDSFTPCRLFRELV